MNLDKYNNDLFGFLKNSPTQYHAVDNMARSLVNRGFVQLKEGESWAVDPHSKYFVTRNGSAIIAFISGDNRPWETGIKIVGAHTDSPCLKVKTMPEIKSHDLMRLGVEVYGGALLNGWLDRALNLAGRLTVLGTDEDGKDILYTILVNYDRAVATIPSLAIHLDREANTKKVINPQFDLPPLFNLYSGPTPSDISSEQDWAVDIQSVTEPSARSFRNILLEQALKEHPNDQIKEILDFDLSFSDAQPPFLTGLNENIISAPRLDNLLSCHAGLKSLIRADSSAPCLLVCTDNEEVGSSTSQGAGGSFIKAVISRLVPDREKRIRTLARSFMISLDNAHAVHPAYADRHDPNHMPYLNMGPVLKINAAQKYASDSESSALLRYICRRADIPLQCFVMRSDMPCGSTIGPLVSAGTGVKTVDVGAPTLGMHAIREVTGANDPFMVFQMLNEFFSMEYLPLQSLI